ncbi:MAG TPA: DUF2065 domain-containing protein [Gammaproteobacteria bacterium]|nr:DUF2065 domain-containing protein [Gammaproteobacteria bacterium]
MWKELLIAVGLVLVFEGIMPFLNPASLRRTLAALTALDDRVVRGIGLGSMIIGIVILYVARFVNV